MATGWCGEVERAMDKWRPTVCLIRSVRDRANNWTSSPPLFAAFIHVASELMFILNGATLLARKRVMDERLEKS
jgi:hypothetical protein